MHIARKTGPHKKIYTFLFSFHILDFAENIQFSINYRLIDTHSLRHSQQYSETQLFVCTRAPFHWDITCWHYTLSQSLSFKNHTNYEIDIAKLLLFIII